MRLAERCAARLSGRSEPKTRARAIAVKGQRYTSVAAVRQGLVACKCYVADSVDCLSPSDSVSLAGLGAARQESRSLRLGHGNSIMETRCGVRRKGVGQVRMYYVMSRVCRYLRVSIGPLVMRCSSLVRARFAGITGLLSSLSSLAVLAPAQTPLERGLEQSWTHLGGSARRASFVSFPAPPSTVPSWAATHDINNDPIAFIGQAPLAVYAGSNVSNGRVFAAGRVDVFPSPPNPYRLYAFDRSTGATVWQSPIAFPRSNSFSAPAIDEHNSTVLYCSGPQVQAFYIADGALAWSATLNRNIVNASPLIVSDSSGRTRVFITDYDGFGNSSRIYCINADVFDAQRNAWAPGEVVWSAAIGAGSGNSVSYLPPERGGQGLVFVPTIAASNSGSVPVPGQIYAFPLESVGTGVPVWTFSNLINEGYFGGLCVVPAPTGSAPDVPPVIFAASYAFDGGTDTANLVKLNARTGELFWSVPCNRTSSIPVPLPAEFIALAGGIDGLFGSVSQVQLFQDSGFAGSLAWDTTGVLRVGGWANQPILTRFGGRNLLAAGSPPAQMWGFSSSLYLLDLSKRPPQPGFVVREYLGVGGSPAMVGSSLYCIGTLGLVAFGPTPDDLDVDRSGVVDIRDLYAWEAAGTHGDVNRDGGIDFLDREELMTALRGGDSVSMIGESR